MVKQQQKYKMINDVYCFISIFVFFSRKVGNCPLHVTEFLIEIAENIESIK